MSKWLDRFRAAEIQKNMSVQLAHLGAVSPPQDLSAPFRPNCTGIDMRNQTVDDGERGRPDSTHDGEGNSRDSRLPTPSGESLQPAPDSPEHARAVSAVSAVRSRAPGDDDWGKLAPIVKWFLAATPPAEPFVLKPAVRITQPPRWWRDTIADIAAGPAGPRARYGGLQDDLWRAYRMFGPAVAPTMEQ